MIKEARIIYPRQTGEIGLKYLPVYNDRHFFNLTLWGAIDNHYRVGAIFFETNNKFLVLFNLIEAIGEPNLDLKTLVIVGSFDNMESIIVETEIYRLPEEYANEFNTLTLPVLPRWGEYIVERKSDMIIVLRCNDVMIKCEDKRPLLKLDCWGIYEDEKEILRSYGVSNLQWG